MTIKKTSLHSAHLKLGARMVEFGGWEMPVIYSSIVEEHNAARKACSLFDISHMGELKLTGAGSSALLRKLIPTDLGRLSPDRCMYSMLCNGEGGVVDDLFIYMIAENDYLLVVNASTTDKDIAWIKKHNTLNAELEDISASTSKLDLQGPASRDVISKLISDDSIKNLQRFNFRYYDILRERVLVSVTGYTGEHGYELYAPNHIAEELWFKILEIGEPFGIKPAGLGARDTLRMECCYSLYGHELSDTISPVEAGLKWVLNSSSGYVGSDPLRTQIECGAPRSLICFELTERGIPREGFPVFAGGEPAGFVTSGGFSPTFQRGIGMALVKTGSIKIGDIFDVEIRGKMSSAVAVKRPFYKFEGKP